MLELLERSEPTWGLELERGPLGALLPLLEAGDLAVLSPSGTEGWGVR